MIPSAENQILKYMLLGGTFHMQIIMFFYML